MTWGIYRYTHTNPGRMRLYYICVHDAIATHSTNWVCMLEEWQILGTDRYTLVTDIFTPYYPGGDL